MGGRVSIVNKTSFAIKVQLCHLSPLYTKQLEPNEIWTQETGAVHFTIKVDVQPRPDADVNQLVFDGHHGILFNGNTVLEADKWKEAEKYVHLTSNGWYFKGDNELEIVGGPVLKDETSDESIRINSRHTSCSGVRVSLQQLKIVRKEKREKKQHSLTPKPPRKSLRSRSQSLGRSMRESMSSKKDPGVENTSTDFVIAPLSTSPVSSDVSQSPNNDTAVALERLESHESALDAFFANLPQGAPHIKVQRITK